MSLFDKMAKAGQVLNDAAKKTQTKQLDEGRSSNDQATKTDDPFSDAAAVDIQDDNSNDLEESE